MMNKNDFLNELSEKIKKGEITRQEVLNKFDLVSERQANQKKTKWFSEWFSDFSITKLLYILGVAIVIVGIITFVSQIWEDIGSFGRILITLGFGFLMTIIGSVLLKQKPEEHIGSIFHIIGGVLIPGGVMVLLSEFDLVPQSMWPIAIAFGIVFVFYLLLNAVHKNPVLTFFTIVNGTVFVYTLFGAIINDYNLDRFLARDLYAYLTMAIGISYLLLSYAFKKSWNEKLIGLLHFFGCFGFLVAAFSQVYDSLFWQLLYFLIVFGGLFLSIYIKSRIVLAVSTIFLIVHISYITSEYFADSIGWPISLVILGFLFIGLGYASVTISQKYIKE